MNITEVFEKQAECTPNATALVFENDALTYGELNQRANNLASSILAHSPDSLIAGVSTIRCIETIISLLAILKAGKAYLPLDPSHPAERLNQIIVDSGIDICLTTTSQKHNFEHLSIHLLFSDESYIVKKTPINNEQLAAYVLYTSGSTGTPKGVSMGHSALINLLSWQQRNSISATGINTLQFAPLSFDVSFQEIFATLTTGGTLILVDDNSRIDPNSLLHYIETKAINRIFLPFVALQYLMEAADSEQFYPICLKEIITAGEQLKITPQVKRFFTALPQCVLYNQYGPTETHVVTQFKLEGDPAQWPFLPSIGTPIDNTEIIILDEHFNRVADGETGELCVIGRCLAEGYLNRPELTAEKFMIWTDAGNNPVRMYRTGDLARYRKDGNIEFLGRIDHQIKIQGCRVEPGEIEDIIVKNKDIKDCVVVLNNNNSIGELVAYFTLRKYKYKVAHTIDNLVANLNTKLPSYMVPSFFVELPTLPLNAHGKVDRKMLPPPEKRYHKTQKNFISPSTSLEKEIALIWKNNLNIKKIGVDDNFFDMGGHSLMVTTVISHINKKLNLKINFSTLYNLPTIRQLAEGIENNKSEKFNPVVQLRQGNGTPLFLFAGVFGSPLTFMRFTEYYIIGQPLYSISNPTDSEDFKYKNAQEYARYIITQIKRYYPSGPYDLLGFSLGGSVAFEVAIQLQQAGDQVGRLIIVSTPPPHVIIKGSVAKRLFYKEIYTFSKLNYKLKLKYIQHRFPRLMKTLFKKSTPGSAENLINTHINKNLFLIWDSYQTNLKYRGSVLIINEDFKISNYSRYNRIATYENFVNPDILWNKYIDGNIDFAVLDCTHEDFFEAPHVATVADIIKKYIQKKIDYQPPISISA